MSLVPNSVCELPDIISAIVSFVSGASLCERVSFISHTTGFWVLKKKLRISFLITSWPLNEKKNLLALFCYSGKQIKWLWKDKWAPNFCNRFVWHEPNVCLPNDKVTLTTAPGKKASWKSLCSLPYPCVFLMFADQSKKLSRPCLIHVAKGIHQLIFFSSSSFIFLYLVASENKQAPL